MKDFDEHKDYYVALGVARDASTSEIKEAFRAQAKVWHPDLNKTQEALAHFESLLEAYTVLTDSKKRHKYDSARFRNTGTSAADVVFTGGMSAAHVVPNIIIQTAVPNAPAALRDRYRSDEWHQLSLKERKRLRARKIQAMPRSRTMWAMTVPFLVLGLIGWSVYEYSPTRSYKPEEPDEPSSLAKRYMNTWLVRIK